LIFLNFTNIIQLINSTTSSDDTIIDESPVVEGWLYAVIGVAGACCCCLTCVLIAMLVFYFRNRSKRNNNHDDNNNTSTSLYEVGAASTFDGTMESVRMEAAPNKTVGVYASTELPMYQSLPTQSTHSSNSAQDNYGHLTVDSVDDHYSPMPTNNAADTPPDYQELQLKPAANQFH